MNKKVILQINNYGKLVFAKQILPFAVHNFTIGDKFAGHKQNKKPSGFQITSFPCSTGVSALVDGVDADYSHLAYVYNLNKQERRFY